MQNQQPSTLKEIRVHGTQDFPCAFYQTGTRIKGNMVKHHWHEEVELLYFSGGEFCLEVNMERFNISEECFYFINPGDSDESDTAGTKWQYPVSEMSAKE